MVIFAAAGDLTFRFLLPALAQLHEAGRLPDGFKIVALAREDWDTETYRSQVAERLDASSSSREALIAMLEYHRADVSDREQVASALEPLREPARPRRRGGSLSPSAKAGRRGWYRSSSTRPTRTALTRRYARRNDVDGAGPRVVPR